MYLELAGPKPGAASANLTQPPDGSTTLATGGLIESTEHTASLAEETRAEAERHAALAGLSLRALAGGDVQPLFEYAVELGAELLDVDLVGIWELLPDERSLLLKAGHGWTEGTVGQTRIELQPGSVPLHLFERGGPLVISDVESQDLTPSPLASRHGVRGVLAVLLSGRYRPLGALAMYTREPRQFTEEDVTLAGGIANVIALAVDRRRVERRLEAQHAAVSALADSEDIDEAGPRILEAITGALDWDLGLLWVREEGVLRCVASALGPHGHAREFGEASLDLTMQRGESFAGRVWQEVRPVWRSDILSSGDLPRREEAERAGLHSTIGFPITGSGGVLGVIELFGGSPSQPDETLLRELAAFGAQVGQFIERGLAQREVARNQERYRHIARTLQQSLLPPSLPEIPGVGLAARFHAAGDGNDVGGDFYDAFRLGGPAWTVSIGDVTGKGADAAAVTALARHTIRAAAIVDPSPREVLSTLNSVLHAQEARLLTTACLTIEPSETGAHVVVACAGHPLPIVIRASGSISEPECRGVILGVGPGFECTEVGLDLDPGDAVVLYTDGVTEARAPEGSPDRFYGVERLRRRAAELAGHTAEDIAGGLERDVLDFQRGQMHDDLAVVVLRVESRAGFETSGE